MPYIFSAFAVSGIGAPSERRHPSDLGVQRHVHGCTLVQPSNHELTTAAHVYTVYTVPDSSTSYSELWGCSSWNKLLQQFLHNSSRPECAYALCLFESPDEQLNVQSSYKQCHSLLQFLPTNLMINGLSQLYYWSYVLSQPNSCLQDQPTRNKEGFIIFHYSHYVKQ